LVHAERRLDQRQGDGEVLAAKINADVGENDAPQQAIGASWGQRPRIRGRLRGIVPRRRRGSRTGHCAVARRKNALAPLLSGIEAVLAPRVPATAVQWTGFKVVVVCNWVLG